MRNDFLYGASDKAWDATPRNASPRAQNVLSNVIPIRHIDQSRHVKTHTLLTLNCLFRMVIIKFTGNDHDFPDFLRIPATLYPLATVNFTFFTLPPRNLSPTALRLTAATIPSCAPPSPSALYLSPSSLLPSPITFSRLFLRPFSTFARSFIIPSISLYPIFRKFLNSQSRR